MSSTNRFGWNSFFIRFLFAIAVVFASYNPEGYAYYHWVDAGLPGFTVLKGFVGIVLLIVWVILIRATLGSLGLFGILLAAAFFGLGIWLIVDVLGMATDNVHVIAYIVEVVLAAVLSIGVSWSHVRRRISGQIDVDEIERD